MRVTSTSRATVLDAIRFTQIFLEGDTFPCQLPRGRRRIRI